MIRTLIFMSINLLSGSVAMVTSPFYIHQDAANLKCGKWGGGGGRILCLIKLIIFLQPIYNLVCD